LFTSAKRRFEVLDLLNMRFSDDALIEKLGQAKWPRSLVPAAGIHPIHIGVERLSAAQGVLAKLNVLMDGS
jgi:hypothetical protein